MGSGRAVTWGRRTANRGWRVGTPVWAETMKRGAEHSFEHLPALGRQFHLSALMEFHAGGCLLWQREPCLFLSRAPPACIPEPSGAPHRPRLLLQLPGDQGPSGHLLAPGETMPHAHKGSCRSVLPTVVLTGSIPKDRETWRKRGLKKPTRTRSRAAEDGASGVSRLSRA